MNYLCSSTVEEMAKANKKTKGEFELQNLELVFRALAHESRRFILIALQSRGGTMIAGDIVSRFDSSWPTMTRHLKQLEEAKLVSTEKIGREQYYTLNKELLLKTVGDWIKWFH